MRYTHAEPGLAEEFPVTEGQRRALLAVLSPDLVDCIQGWDTKDPAVEEKYSCELDGKGETVWVVIHHKLAWRADDAVTPGARVKENGPMIYVVTVERLAPEGT